MEKYNFAGKGLNDKEKKGASFAIEKKKYLAAEPGQFPNEIPKNKEDIEQIKRVTDDINRELENLDLSPDFSVNPYQVHFVSEISESNVMGRYTMENQHIQIKEPRSSLSNNPIRLNKYIIYNILSRISTLNLDKKKIESEILIHESIHLHSHQVHWVDVKNKQLGQYRIGYELEGRENIDYFRGFNEAVVQKTTEDIILKSHPDSNLPNIQKKLFSLRGAYFPEILTLDKIIGKIAKVKNETREEVWNRFKKGQFTGEMMHLRDVEKVYGPGALRILASMDTRKSNKLKNFLYYTYFSSDNKNIKDSIARILLRKEKEIKKSYDQHIDKMK